MSVESGISEIIGTLSSGLNDCSVPILISVLYGQVLVWTFTKTQIIYQAFTFKKRYTNIMQKLDPVFMNLYF